MKKDFYKIRIWKLYLFTIIIQPSLTFKTKFNKFEKVYIIEL